MKNVLVIGSLNMDYTLYMDEFPLPGETIYGSSRFIQPGGKGANQAVAIANSGQVKCVFVAGRGLDNDGETIAKVLLDKGVDTHLVCFDKVPTGNATILVDNHSENQIVIVAGANGELKPEHIDIELIKQADYIVLQNEISEETNAYVMKEAHKLNKVVIYNPAPYREVNNEVFKYVDYFVPNKVELSKYSGVEDVEEGIKIMLSRGAKNVLVTLGTSGSYLRNGKESIKVDACKVKAVDTVAAGDTYVGYFVSSLAHGYSEKEAMEYASKASSITVSRKGSIVSIPAGKEVY